jgi:hypothetical protein
VIEVPDGLTQRQATFLEQVVEGQARAIRDPARQFHHEPEIRPEEDLTGPGTVLDHASQRVVGVAVVAGGDQVLGVEPRFDPPGQVLLLLGAQQRGRENEFRGVHDRNAATARATGPELRGGLPTPRGEVTTPGGPG